MNEKLHIDSNVNILTGEAAEKALQRENDEKYFHENEGVAQVEKNRWTTAQKAERKHWMELGLRAADDRNYDHAAFFDGYRTLRGLSFDHAIELGCGPFTNLRLIANACEIRQCTLLDPLIREYLTHPQCRYRSGNLVKDRPSNSALARNVRKVLWRSMPGGMRRWLPGISVKAMLDMPIEEMPLDCTYDLVVMINVIEHCYDVRLLLDNLLRVLKPGGVFVFNDRLYEASVIRERVREKYDAAHPLRVDQKILQDFIQKHFEPLFEKTDERIHAFRGREETLRTVYFIGRKS
ncbi:MAG: methyltransferase domain-containing protein [Kiritimatiellia bacterium]